MIEWLEWCIQLREQQRWWTQIVHFGPACVCWHGNRAEVKHGGALMICQCLLSICVWAPLAENGAQCKWQTCLTSLCEHILDCIALFSRVSPPAHYSRLRRILECYFREESFPSVDICVRLSACLLRVTTKPKESKVFSVFACVDAPNLTAVVFCWQNMNQGRIKKILLPFIVKHILLSLIGAAIIFIGYSMFNLVITLVKEINLMSDHHHQLSTSEGKLWISLFQIVNSCFTLVLYYIKTFLSLVLFGSLQLFGLYGVVKLNRNILVAFISSLAVAAIVFLLFDHLLQSGYFLVSIFYGFEAAITYLFILINMPRQREISNIHYIPMPSHESNAQLASTYKYFQV